MAGGGESVDLLLGDEGAFPPLSRLQRSNEAVFLGVGEMEVEIIAEADEDIIRCAAAGCDVNMDRGIIAVERQAAVSTGEHRDALEEGQPDLMVDEAAASHEVGGNDTLHGKQSWAKNVAGATDVEKQKWPEAAVLKEGEDVYVLFPIEAYRRMEEQFRYTAIAGFYGGKPSTDCSPALAFTFSTWLLKS